MPSSVIDGMAFRENRRPSCDLAASRVGSCFTPYDKEYINLGTMLR